MRNTSRKSGKHKRTSPKKYHGAALIGARAVRLSKTQNAIWHALQPELEKSVAKDHGFLVAGTSYISEDWPRKLLAMMMISRMNWNCRLTSSGACRLLS